MLALVAILALAQPLPGGNYGIVDGADNPSLAPNSGLVSSGVLFDFNPGARVPSISNLDSSMCINGTCVAPNLLYVGTDATVASWVPRYDAQGNGTLTNDADGTDMTVGAGTPLLGSDTAVDFNAGDAYEESGTAAGQIGTDDFVFEMVLSPATSLVTVWSRYAGASASWGWYFNNSTTLRLGLVTGGVTTNVDCTVSASGWIHVIAFGNRDEASANGWKAYANGTLCGSGDISARSATLDSSAVMTLGDQPAASGASPYTDQILYAAQWKRASWHQAGAAGPTEWAAVAVERFSRLSGVWPASARGAYAPTTMTRASTGTLSKCTSNVTSLFLMGANWPRAASDCSGNALFWHEPQVTNTFLQSRTLATSWTKLDAGDSIGGSVVTPFGITSTLAGYIGDATDGDHGVSQAATVTAAVWTMSVVAKAGGDTWAYMSDDTVANATGYFNLSTCATGTKGAGGRELFATSLGNGWCQIGLSFTGTAAAHTFAIQSADADGDKSIVGDGATVMGYFTEMQLERWDHPTSRYPTTTATAARSVDSLKFAGASNINTTAGSVVCSGLIPAHDAADSKTLLSADDGDSTDLVATYANTSNAGLLSIRASGAGVASIAGTTNVIDGAIHTLSGSWALNDARLFVDGAAEGTPDTVVPAIAASTTIEIGVSLGGANIGGGIKRCRIYNRTNVRQ